MPLAHLPHVWQARQYLHLHHELSHTNDCGDKRGFKTQSIVRRQRHLARRRRNLTVPPNPALNRTGRCVPSLLVHIGAARRLA
jgi:hypothetical protein